MLVIHVGCAEIVCVANFEHFFYMHGFFFFPGPPNLGLSKQNLHEPQSLARHPLHSLHLLRLLPKISYYICMAVLCQLTNHYCILDRDWLMVFN